MQSRRELSEQKNSTTRMVFCDERTVINHIFYKQTNVKLVVWQIDVEILKLFAGPSVLSDDL